MSTRDKLLQNLDGRDHETVSGVQLASRLGLTRASIWKQMKTLQRDGLPIRSTERNGYQMPERADFSLSRLQFGATLRSWARPHYEVAMSSTQIPAKEAAEQGLPEGHLWIAEVQSAGRGRLDRTWASSYGGLWFSLLLRPSLPPARLPPLTQVAALVLTKVLRDRYGIDARLKWPNDIGIGRGNRWRKVAGLLTEMAGEMDRTKWLVLGLGLNVFNRLPPSLARQATCLADHTSKKLDRASLLETYLKEFRSAYQKFERQGFEPFQKEYWQLYRQRGENVKVNTAHGLVRGQARGVDGQGGLVVEFRRQIYHLLEGEILS